MTATVPRNERVARIWFQLSVLVLVFLGGFLVSHYRWFPHAFLAQALAQMESAGAGAPAVPLYAHPRRHPLQGVVAHRPDAGPPGCILLTTHWPGDPELPGVALIDRAGAVLHRWAVDPAAIWRGAKRSDSVGAGLDRADNSIHGTYLFPDGDLLCSVDYVGLVRLGPGGEVRWRIDERTHHSVTRADDGNFWVCAARWLEQQEDVTRRFPGLTAPLVEDLALCISPQGEVLCELSMLEVVYGSELRPLLWQMPRSKDLLHMNDVEPLPAGLAAGYPSFTAGDLLVSLRDLALVLVCSADGTQIKWSAPRPLFGQHDPDFVGDGWISVFDNQAEESLDGRFLGGSRLLAFRPHTGERRQLYPAAEDPSSGERRFFTIRCGKAQPLPLGHWLLTESCAGRVFEIDADGRTVWEWFHAPRADGLTIAEVQEGTAYPFTAADIAQWQHQ